MDKWTMNWQQYFIDQYATFERNRINAIKDAQARNRASIAQDSEERHRQNVALWDSIGVNKSELTESDWLIMQNTVAAFHGLETTRLGMPISTRISVQTTNEDVLKKLNATNRWILKFVTVNGGAFYGHCYYEYLKSDSLTFMQKTRPLIALSESLPVNPDDSTRLAAALGKMVNDCINAEKRFYEVLDRFLKAVKTGRASRQQKLEKIRAIEEKVMKGLMNNVTN